MCIAVHTQTQYARDLSYVYVHVHVHMHGHVRVDAHVSNTHIGWLRLVGSIKLQVSFAKEPYERDAILQKTPTI